MTRLFSRRSLVAAAMLLVMGCGHKESQPPSGTSDVICSYAPSQSNAVTNIASVAGGSAATAAAIAQATGLSAVLHSSGAYIFTGSAGYVAGTIGAAGALPAVVVVGVTAGTVAVSLELVCAAKNHPEVVAKVEAAAAKFYQRSKTAVENGANHSTRAAAPVVARIERIIEDARDSVFD